MMIEPEQLAEIIIEYLDNHSKIDYNTLPSSVQSAIQESPEQVFAVIRKVAPEHRTWANIESFYVPLTETFIEYADKAIMVEGRIIGISDNKPVNIEIVWNCENCGIANITNGKKPKKCKKCEEKDFKMDYPASEIQDAQIIKLHDGSVSFTCQLIGKERMWMAKPGEKVQAFGVLKYEGYIDSKTGQPEHTKKLVTESLIKTQQTSMDLTPQDIIKIMGMVGSPNFYQTLLESFAPHLYGMEEQKEVALMTLASQGISRPFNTLIAGPPARGKTELIKYVIALSQNGHYTAITNATLAGLTSAVENDPETQTRVTKPGLFAMADGGIVGITELQAIRTKEELKISLNDALESKEIASSKADGAVRLQARCAVLMDSNNHKGSWEYLDPLWKNLKYMEPNLGAFLSRLDLISITANETDKEVFKQIARRNFDSYKDKGSVLEYHKEDWDNHYGFITLQKYFAYVTSQPLPPLAEELQEQYADNYVNALEQSPEYAVDGRYNRTIALLARVRARLLLKEKADGEDMNEAIRMVNKSKEIETLQPDGTRDSNASRGLPTKAQIERKENQQEQFAEAFDRCTKSWEEKDGTTKRYAKHDELVYELTTRYHWSEYKALEKIGVMLHKGLIMEENGQEKYTKA